jgi:hypothetical protein
VKKDYHRLAGDGNHLFRDLVMHLVLRKLRRLPDLALMVAALSIILAVLQAFVEEIAVEAYNRNFLTALAR